MTARRFAYANRRTPMANPLNGLVESRSLLSQGLPIGLERAYRKALRLSCISTGCPAPDADGPLCVDDHALKNCDPIPLIRVRWTIGSGGFYRSPRWFSLRGVDRPLGQATCRRHANRNPRHHWKTV